MKKMYHITIYRKNGFTDTFMISDISNLKEAESIALQSCGDGDVVAIIREIEEINKKIYV